MQFLMATPPADLRVFCHVQLQLDVRCYAWTGNDDKNRLPSRFHTLLCLFNEIARGRCAVDDGVRMSERIVDGIFRSRLVAKRPPQGNVRLAEGHG